MEFLGFIREFGGSAAMLALVIVIFILLLREVRRDNERTREALADHKQSLTEMLREHKDQTEKQIRIQAEAIAKLGERISQIEREYATIDYAQEINSNWRTEIRQLNEKIDKLIMEARR